MDAAAFIGPGAIKYRIIDVIDMTILNGELNYEER